MNNFEINMKTRVIVGKGTHKTVGKEVKKYADACLIVDDGGPYLAAILADVKESLETEGIRYMEWSKVRPNPLYSAVLDAKQVILDNDLKFVLAVGGGSTMDTGKFLAVQAVTDYDCTQLTYGVTIDVTPLPHGCISTLSGTGSEADMCAMIVDDRVEPNFKHTVFSSHMFCDFAIINPELTYSLPARQTAAGAMDIMSHSWETYFVENPNEDLSDYYIEGIDKTVMKYAPIAIKDPTNYQARANLCLAANMIMMPCLAYSGSASYWVVHGLENPITTQFRKTHGETLGIITLAYVKWCHAHGKNIKKLTKWATEVMGAEMDYFTPEDTLLAGCEKLAAWLKSVGLSTTLEEYGLGDADLTPCAKAVVKAGSTGLDFDTVMEIYSYAK